MAKLQTPRGTQDLLPDVQRAHRFISDKALKVAQNFGFSEVSTPIFESTSVFKRSLGDASDIVNKEMYTFEDRGGSQLTLRPEGTAGIARAVVSEGLTRETPLKFFYQGPMFRYERPQKGRYRQFHQLGIELIGVTNPLADVECIELAYDFLKEIGVSGKVQLEINSIGDQESRAAYREALVAYLEGHKDRLSEDSLKRLELNPLRILDSKDEGDKEICKNAPKLGEYLNEESRNIFEKVKSGLKALSIPFVENDNLVRGLDYYTHVVFEFTTTHLGAQNAVLAGGRYDHLIELMGGPELSGVGWASGIERLALLLDEVVQAARPIVMCPLGESEELAAIALAKELRELAPVEFTYNGNFGKRLKKASKANARFAIIIGETELADGKVLIKDLDQGCQEHIPMSEVKAFIEKTLV